MPFKFSIIRTPYKVVQLASRSHRLEVNTSIALQRIWRRYLHHGNRRVSQENKVPFLCLTATLIPSLASTTLHSSFTIGFFYLTRNLRSQTRIRSGPRPTWGTCRSRRRRKLAGASRSSRPAPASSASPSTPPPPPSGHRPLLAPYSQQEVVTGHGSVLTTHQTPS